MGVEIAISLSLLLVGIGILVGIHMCVVGRAFRRRDGQAEEDDLHIRSSSRSRNMKMSIEELKGLPCFDYKAQAGGAVECVVCLENLRVGEKCKELPNCRHSFHSHCIDSWLMKSPICPLCRASVHHQKVAQAIGHLQNIS